MKFNITIDKDERLATYDPGKLRIKEHKYSEFYENLQRIASVTFQFEDRGRSNEFLDEALTQSWKQPGTYKNSRKTRSDTKSGEGNEWKQ